MKRAVIVLAALALASCASVPGPEPKIEVRTVSVPVAVKCAADPGSPPAYADSPEAVAKAPDIFTVAKLRMQGRAQRIARLIQLEAANSACR